MTRSDVLQICARPGCGHDLGAHLAMVADHCAGRIPPALTATNIDGPCRCQAFVFPNATITVNTTVIR